MLSPLDARDRIVVRLPDGRTARLFFLPGSKSSRCGTAKAKVQLRSGTIISVPVNDLVDYDEWLARDDALGSEQGA